MDLDPAFGHWLAGFIDGEGSFMIMRDTRLHTRFSLCLRADEADIIHEIRRRTGFGRIYHRPAISTSQPQIWWRLQSQPDCIRLTHVLDAYPLRAKKARDYEIWRLAAHTKDQARLAHLKTQLTATRAYRDAAAPPDTPTVEAQTTFTI